jgi:tetratricopeptide (TPR) repeat protein
MDPGLLWTAVGSAAGIIAAGLAVWQIRLQIQARRRTEQEREDARATASTGHGLPVTIPLGALPPEIRGREALLEELRRALARRPGQVGRVWVLAGMGGLGKSTMALALAETALSRKWRVWWVTATDRSVLAGGILEILHQLGAPPSVISPIREGTPVAAERAWEFLNAVQPIGRWLLVFDNVDDASVLAAQDALSPANYVGWLRPSPSGIVLVTTRSKDRNLWGPRVNFRELAPLDDEAAGRVLADLAPGAADPTGEEAMRLGRRLGGLPLALHLAGSYLASPFARWDSFAGYREGLDSSDLPAMLEDLDQEAHDERAMISRTWELSLDELADRGRPQARQLLSLLACYAPATSISTDLLQSELVDDFLSESTGDALGASANASKGGSQRLRYGLRSLAEVGLIELSGNAQAITLHPVVADVTRARLLNGSRTDLLQTGRTAMQLLQAAWRQDPNLARADQLVRHLTALLDWLAPHLDDNLVIAILETVDEMSRVLVDSGNLATAEKLARSTVTASSFLGLHHAALAARASLAEAIGLQGHNRQAEELYRLLLADQEQILGSGHPDYLTTSDQLGRMILYQGRYADAERIWRQVLSGRRQNGGDDHSDTLRTRQNLARAIGAQRRYAEAEQLFRQVLASRQRILGDRHPETLDTLSSLAAVTGRQQRYDEAESLCREALTGTQQIFGMTHPSALEIQHDLGWIVGRQGRYEEAEQIFREVLRGRQHLFGPDHPATLNTRHRLAQTIASRGHLAEAEEMLRQLLADRRRILEENHPDIEITDRDLAEVISKNNQSPSR